MVAQIDGRALRVVEVDDRADLAQVRVEAASERRVQAVHGSTGSSWINQVERWFAFLTDQLLRRGVHKSVQALEKDVRDWIAASWSTKPLPMALARSCWKPVR
ncbi:hypothetical protein HDA39_000050 [Kribbella italica]|uniref:Uncharacterized protein n=1 Tax=Kribbella italica TaxID=1540520 RepID=A0A7W9J0D2_9ACTN|nr:hypothetical protein [Kribbella italica]